MHDKYPNAETEDKRERENRRGVNRAIAERGPVASTVRERERKPPERPEARDESDVESKRG